MHLNLEKYVHVPNTTLLPRFVCIPRHKQPRRCGFVRGERAHRVRQHLELPTDRYLRGALAQDPRPSVPDSLKLALLV